MAKATLVFKSGAVVKVDLKSFTNKKNALGATVAMEWENGHDKIIRLAIDDVSAVIWHA